MATKPTKPLTPAQVLAREHAKARREGLELAMAQQLRALGLDGGMVAQFRVDKTRQHRADFAWPAQMLLLEISGGTWDGGAHGRGSGIERDYEKAAIAVIHGYRTLFASTSQVRSGIAAQWVSLALGRDA